MARAAELPSVTQTPYYGIRYELAAYDSLIFKGDRMVILKSMRADIERETRSYHTGTEGRLRRARQRIF